MCHSIQHVCNKSRKNLFSGGYLNPKMRRVDMFHGGTLDSVKIHILDEVVKQDTYLRVVICTIAFGMGVNCKRVSESFHFDENL